MKVKFEAYGVRGMKSTPWRKVFSSQEKFEAWLDKNEGDITLYGVREVTC